MGRRKIIWTSANGEKYQINQMEHAHVFNTICMIEKNLETSPWIKKTKIYKALKRRLNVCEKGK